MTYAIFQRFDTERVNFLTWFDCDSAVDLQQYVESEAAFLEDSGFPSQVEAMPKDEFLKLEEQIKAKQRRFVSSTGFEGIEV